MRDDSIIHSIDPTIKAEVGAKINNTARRKILLVEDEKVTSMVEAEIIKRNGYEVTTVISGEKAIEAIRTDPSIDLVLMDIELGEGIDGTEAAKQILEVRSLPIVFLTSHSEREMVEKVCDIARYGYVIKNSGSSVLLSSIEMAFELFEAHGNVERKNEELTEANRKLWEREVLLKETGRMAKVGGWEFDIITLDPVWTEEIYRIHEVDLTYKPTVSKAIEFYAPSSRPVIEQAVQRAVEHGEAFDVELEFITAKGNLRWVHAVGKADHKRGKILGTFQDITERKQAEKALQKSRTQYRALIETTDTGYVISDIGGRVLDANPEYVRLSGHRDLNEIRGRSFIEWTADYEKEKNAEAVLKCVNDGLIRNLNIDYVDIHGNITPIEINATVVEVEGTPQILTLCRDITKRRKAEEMLLQSKEELRILSSHLQNVREEERTSIAREIHDELGQILTSLKMDLTWLRRKLPEQQKHLHSRASLMCDDINSAINTVHSVLTRLRPFILDDFGITAVIRWHTGDWQARTGISCALSLSSEEIPLPGEVATVLFRIFQEALTNVARHADATEVKVSLMEKEKTIVLTINDNGRGITEKQSKGVTALGILGMKERAYALGGEVIIHGAKGKGTTLIATFPMEKRK